MSASLIIHNEQFYLQHIEDGMTVALQSDPCPNLFVSCHCSLKYLTPPAFNGVYAYVDWSRNGESVFLNNGVACICSGTMKNPKIPPNSTIQLQDTSNIKLEVDVQCL